MHRRPPPHTHTLPRFYESRALFFGRILLLLPFLDPLKYSIEVLDFMKILYSSVLPRKILVHNYHCRLSNSNKPLARVGLEYHVSVAASNYRLR